MNNQPVTVEQLMQAVSILGARQEYKQYALTNPVLLKQAYNFVRACQEELPKFVETEVTLQAALAARPPRLPDGPVVTFEQAAVQITNLAPRRGKEKIRTVPERRPGLPRRDSAVQRPRSSRESD